MNPWEEINLSDYENHMKLESVYQLQALNKMMWGQLNDYDVSSVLILGVAGGNGLNHVDRDKINVVYGVDINEDYLKICKERYPVLEDLFVPIRADITNEFCELPKADIVIADLFVEYVGCEIFASTIRKIKPKYVSVIIQVNEDDGFVSDSPYMAELKKLEKVHFCIDEKETTLSMKKIDYNLSYRTEENLPNGKKLIRLDYCFNLKD